MELNWDRCVICQQETGEPLKCPLLSPGSSRDNTDAYTSFLTNVEQFRAIGTLPAELYFGSDETVANFASHSASWHKSCHLKFNNSKLAKAKKKRERNHDDEEKKPSKRKALDVQKCLFCEKGEEEHVLHEVSTFYADKNIRSQFGTPGMFMKTSQRHLCISPVTPSSCWISTMTISKRSRD